MDSATHRNVQEIVDIERAALENRTAAERLGDSIASKAGRMWFILLHALWFLLWIGMNAIPGVAAFDPFPFSFLALVISLEAIFLSLFILMSQNRANRQADRRSHLDLQINLLSEHENTQMLKMLQALCSHHGLAIGEDSEIAELAAQTKPQEVLQELSKNIPTSENPDDPDKQGDAS